jgi:hypothetical protein
MTLLPALLTLALLLALVAALWRADARTLALYRAEHGKACDERIRAQEQALRHLARVAELEQAAREREERHGAERAAWAQAAAAERAKLFDAYRADTSALVDNLAALPAVLGRGATPVGAGDRLEATVPTGYEDEDLEERLAAARALEEALAQREAAWTADPEPVGGLGDPTPGELEVPAG